MSLYHITGIIIWIHGLGLANVGTGFSSITIKAINGVSKYTNTLKPYQLDIGRAMGLYSRC